MFIENTTPYVGKIKLKFDNDPYQTDGNPYSLLNKIHLDLGFTKIISRVYPNQLRNGYHELDSDKIRLIILNTKGKIGIHEWWDVSSKKTGKTQTKYTEPDEKIWDIRFHGILEESFVSQDEDYIGDIQDAWWYYQNNLEVCEEYPGQVAKKLGENGEIIGYYGYTHRGGSIFTKGDRLFDVNYKPKQEDYPDWQWAGWLRTMEESNGEGLLKGKTKEIQSYIPFNMRGNKIIVTWDDAMQAAINLSKYL